MLATRLSWLYAPLCFMLAAADKTTTVVSITSTTTVHVTATDYSGACDNFVGACVVYGTDANAPYTTTVYQYAPTNTPPSPPPPPPSPTSRTPASTTVVTSTTVIAATTTVSNSGDCSGFRGACVVYGTDGNGGTSTVYYAGSSAAPQAGNGGGNGNGYIGPKEAGGGDGVIGSAASNGRWTCIAVLGLATLCAMLML